VWCKVDAQAILDIGERKHGSSFRLAACAVVKLNTPSLTVPIEFDAATSNVTVLNLCIGRAEKMIVARGGHDCRGALDTHRRLRCLKRMRPSASALPRLFFNRLAYSTDNRGIMKSAYRLWLRLSKKGSSAYAGAVPPLCWKHGNCREFTKSVIRNEQRYPLIDFRNV
jgi:hypothetical protein